MGRENRREAVAALHRAHILSAAETLFSEKGFAPTTIDDISKASGYSRRTIYAYFDTKEDILCHIVEKGLTELKRNLESAVCSGGDFMAQYAAVCAAIRKYRRNYPYSAERVDRAGTAAETERSETVRRIFALGTEINALLAGWLDAGKKSGVVRRDINSLLSVYILWSGIASFLSLVETKGAFLAAQLSLTEEELLDCGFRQLLRSVLAEREAAHDAL